MTSKTARRLAAGLALLSVSAFAETPRVQFVNVTREAGITVSHENGASPEKLMMETFGSGGAWLDYDGLEKT